MSDAMLRVFELFHKNHSVPDSGYVNTTKVVLDYEHHPDEPVTDEQAGWADSEFMPLE